MIRQFFIPILCTNSKILHQVEILNTYTKNRLYDVTKVICHASSCSPLVIEQKKSDQNWLIFVQLAHVKTVSNLLHQKNIAPSLWRHNYDDYCRFFSLKSLRRLKLETYFWQNVKIRESKKVIAKKLVFLTFCTKLYIAQLPELFTQRFSAQQTGNLRSEIIP